MTEFERKQQIIWNPSITGAKCEDTILVSTDGNEVLTEIAGWPTIPIALPGRPQPILRPAILEIT
jgi:hypothetical protein